MLQSLFRFLTTPWRESSSSSNHYNTDPCRNSAGYSALISQYYFCELKAARVFKSGTSKSG